MSGSLNDFMADIFTNPAKLSAVIWAVLAGSYSFWEHVWPGKEPSNETKTRLSILVPFGAAFAIYWLGVINGWWWYSSQGLSEAMWQTGQAVVGSQIIHGLTRLGQDGVEKLTVKRKHRRAKKGK